ncbi:MAG: protein-glutamate O-methyltransferase CheR [Deltaproteobacteria bacterium]
MALELTPQLFAIFATLVEQACGLHYDPIDRDLFGTKLAAHAAELGYDSLLDFYYRLRYDDPDGCELQKLAEALVVHETYFFRELAPLRTLVDVYLAQAIAERGRARVWSAACATGEEPLTLAMLLAERGVLEKVEIHATDLSSAAITRAKEGRHARRALRADHPIELAQRYLDRVGTGMIVTPWIHRAVQFRTLNLLDDAAVAALGRFDVILCRNVLIYFSDALVVKIVDKLARALQPHGVIAVGISESLLRFGTSLVCEERGNHFFYRGAT